MTKRELLIRELSRCKNEGLRVFINTSDKYGFNYGLITDGINMISIDFAEYNSNGFTTSFEYVPSKNCGDGCRTLKKGYMYRKLTKEVFEEAVKEGKCLARKYKATLYKNVDHFFIDEWHKKAYTEL